MNVHVLESALASQDSASHGNRLQVGATIDQKVINGKAHQQVAGGVEFGRIKRVTRLLPFSPDGDLAAFLGRGCQSPVYDEGVNQCCGCAHCGQTADKFAPGQFARDKPVEEIIGFELVRHLKPPDYSWVS